MSEGRARTQIFLSAARQIQTVCGISAARDGLASGWALRGAQRMRDGWRDREMEGGMDG